MQSERERSCYCKAAGGQGRDAASVKQHKQRRPHLEESEVLMLLDVDDPVRVPPDDPHCKAIAAYIVKQLMRYCKATRCYSKAIDAASGALL